MSDQLIQIEHLRKSFGGNEVLKGIDLTISRGDAIAIIGQSGCGKSVLLKHLIRLLKPDEGTVTFDGQDIATADSRWLREMRYRVGVLFQSAALFDSMSVAENVGLGLKESREYSPKQIAEKVAEKLDLVGLGSATNKYPSELSGGMRKRVGLARAIATDPEVLLYDEPTTGLDPITSDMINDLIVDLRDKLNVTSIAVTHDMVSAYKIADRIVMLYDGVVQFDGTPKDAQTTDDPIVQQFINGRAIGPIQVR